MERQPLRLDLRIVEDIVDDGQERLARAPDRLDVEALFVGEASLEQDVGHADHAVHRRPDLVAHVGEEGGLRAIRGLRLFPRALERLLPPDGRRDVERERDHVPVPRAPVDQAGELPVPEPQRDRLDHGLAPAGEHPRAPVLPPLRSDVDQTLARGDFEKLGIVDAGADVVHPLERREIGRIRRDHRAVRVEDGEAVPDRLDRVPEPPLGDLHRVLRALEVVADDAALLAERFRLAPLDREPIRQQTGVSCDLLVRLGQLGLAALEDPLGGEARAPFDRQAVVIAHAMLRRGPLTAETGGQR
jgi:hypothetical protein